MSGQRLAQLSSPYLRLHAGNPVDWYPWGEEAFARARDENKPIFLSIGYYTCHWCHVMEQESFSDPKLAELLNREFVSIKVDREERPDVDRVYMAYLQATTGGGGWPMSVFLTPELKPFYGGTYFPPVPRYQMPAFRGVLQSLAQAWHEDPENVRTAAAQAVAVLGKAMQPAHAESLASAPPTPGELLAASWPRLYAQLHANFDAETGGFGGAPKFPRPVAYHFLLRYARRHRGSEAAAEAVRMVTTTLRAMAAGGIHDVLGGGFHRYAVDANWRVPHFEKMLYDQAQLAVSYLEAWQTTHQPEFDATARTTLDFVLREMTSPEGGFYSALDADSPLPGGEVRPDGAKTGEGAYYLWSRAEIETVLEPTIGTAATRAFIEHYDVRAAGNVPHELDPHSEFPGKNILHGENTAGHEAARRRLLAARELRPRPPRDEKVLTAWNALMISALALAARALEEPRYLEAAQTAARWIERERWSAPASQGHTGTLARTPGVEGFAEDYAYLVQALLDLNQADFDRHWLDWARALQRAQEERFAAPGGGYFSTSGDANLYLRVREEYDGAEPSPNSVAASNLQRLALWFESDGWREKAGRLLASFADRLRQEPMAVPLMAATLEAASVPPRRLLISGADNAEGTQALLRVVRERFLPEYDVMRGVAVSGAAPSPETEAGPPAAYLCNDFTCQLPITDPARLAESLDASGTQS